MSVQRSLAMGLVAATALVGAAAASAEIDKSASAVLAGAIKPAMQTKLKKLVPGLVITKVTCYVPTTSALIAGKCTAKFTVAKYDLLGTYQTKASMSSTSMLKWSTLSRACTDLRGRRASCNGESSTGNGLISAQLAEVQLLTNGFVFKSAQKKATSAVCEGLKSHKWNRGEFDDVYAQLSCDVKAADGSYRLVLVMTKADGYTLTNVTKRS